MPLPTKTNKKKLILLYGAAVVLCFAIGFGGLKLWRHYHPAHTADGQPVNLQPATDAEKKEADQNKQNIVNRDEETNNSAKNSAGDTPEKKSATIVITSADSNEVRAYVSGVFEEGGTCKAVATLNAQSATSTSSGFENVSYTQCAPLKWSTPLTPGTWSVTLTYSSDTTSATLTKHFEVK